MASIILFHHACGLTPGMVAFAERLRIAGHTVIAPDLYDGERFDTIDAGVANAETIGLGAIADRGVAAATDAIGLGAVQGEAAPVQGEAAPVQTGEIGQPVIALGFSLGVLPAQKLAQTVSGVDAVILYHGGVPASVFGERWPDDVALQLHLSREDEWAEPDVVEALAAEVSGSELFWYQGSEHLTTDSSRPEYDAETTELVIERSLRLIQGCEDRLKATDG